MARMATPKAGQHSGKSKKKASGNDEKWTTEDVLQAVIIGDSFNFRFLPVTREKPRVRTIFIFSFICRLDTRHYSTCTCHR